MRSITALLPILVAGSVLTARLASSQEIVIDKMWSTTWNYSKVQELSDPNIKFVAGSPLTASVNVTAEVSADSNNHDQIGIAIQDNQVHQTVDAFGGGITDSVAITLQDFKAKHPKDYDDLLHLLFAQDPEWFARGGVGMNSVRVPLGASDFGVSPYTYDDTEDGSEDPQLELFTIKKAPKLWLTLKDIIAVNPSIKIFTAAWSAPGWMKENANADQPLYGGDLKPGMEQTYANYLVKAISEIKKQEDIDIYALSPGNEPQIPELKYPTMKISAEQSIQLGVLLRSGLDAAGFKSVKLVVWDFNWDNTDYPLQVLNADPSPWAGIAWHGYAGQPSAQKVITDAFPSIDTYFTEHTGVTQYFSEPYKNMKNTARDLIIGSIRYASRSLIMWNLVLRKDEDGFTTPHLPNVCENCNAAILLLPESTDAALNQGDPNHIKTVAEANGGTAAKKDAATLPVKKKKKNEDDDTPPSAPAKKDPVAPIAPVSPAAAAADARRKRSIARRAQSGSDTVSFTPVTPSKATLARSDQAIAPSKIVDAKKTGSSSVYDSPLFKRTSDLSVLSHLSTAVRPVGASQTYSKRIGVSSTDELTELGGRVLAQAFRQDGVKPGVSRFSVVLLNQNDHYETGVFEAATAVIAFRGMIANVTTVPGLYTLSWEAPTDAAPSTVPVEGPGGGDASADTGSTGAAAAQKQEAAAAA